MGAPERMFCKMLPLDPDRRTVLAASQMGPKEVLFYQRLAPHLALRAPDVYVARHDPTDESFVLLMEDLGASGCRVSDGTWGITPDSAAIALEDLAALHVRFEDSRRREAEVPWAPLAEDVPPYGMAPLRYGLAHHRDRLSDSFARVAEIYIADPLELKRLWANGPGPATVVHGDTHIGNLFDHGGRTGFLDWGVINVTTPLRDASYFIIMAMQIEDRRAHERDLLRHYLEARAARGGEPIGWERRLAGPSAARALLRRGRVLHREVPGRCAAGATDLRQRLPGPGRSGDQRPRLARGVGRRTVGPRCFRAKETLLNRRIGPRRIAQGWASGSIHSQVLADSTSVKRSPWAAPAPDAPSLRPCKTKATATASAPPANGPAI
jgi:hypothetical protein